MESLTYLFASHTVAELQWLWIRKKLQTLPCSTMTSAHPARPHLHIKHISLVIFLFLLDSQGLNLDRNRAIDTHLSMNEWCLLWSERCVCSAGLRRCTCTSPSVPRCLVWGTEGIRLPRGAAPGPAQPEPPTGSTPVWFSCRIWRWAWVRWTWWRSRWGRSSGDYAGRHMGWPVCDPPPVLHHLKDIIHTFICQKSSSLWKLCHHLTSKLTLDLPRGSPHLGLVSRYERAEVGVVGEITQNPQRAHHSEQTLVVCGFDGWILQSFLGRGRVCGPGHLRDGVDVVRGAGDRLISHLHDHWLDDSCKKKHRRQECDCLRVIRLHWWQWQPDTHILVCF